MCVCVQSLMVAKAKEELEQEIVDKEEEKRGIWQRQTLHYTLGV